MQAETDHANRQNRIRLIRWVTQTGWVRQTDWVRQTRWIRQTGWVGQTCWITQAGWVRQTSWVRQAEVQDFNPMHAILRTPEALQT